MILSSEAGRLFKSLDRRLVLGVVARPGRQLAEAELAQLTADRRLVQANAEFLVDPPGEVLQPPADNAVDSRDRPAFHDRRQGPALVIVQLRWVARRLAINQAIWALFVEGQNPIPDRLQPDPADAPRVRAGAAVIDLSQRQKATPLARIPGRLHAASQGGSVKIRAQRNRNAHGGPPPPTH